MSYSFDALRMFRFAVAIGAALTLAACSSDKTDADGLNGGANSGFGAGGAGTPGSAQDFVVNVGDRVFFETDSSDLTSTATATLDKQSQWLNQYPRYSITIEGHADERGTREYNFALGARRSQTVRDYLASKGVSASRIKNTSFGKERPVAVCDDISCWSQNRRGVTVLNGQ
jgi:peptidoglycan-associated lipoprotein